VLPAVGAFKGAFDHDFPGSYVLDLVTRYPSPIKNASEVPTGVEVYRQVLAAQPDHSVTISSIGFTTNLEDLLKSPPDTFSPYDLLGRGPALLLTSFAACVGLPRGPGGLPLYHVPPSPLWLGLRCRIHALSTTYFST